jgi:hypothetical protein
VALVQVGLLLLPTCWGCPANVIKAPLHGISGSSIGIKCYLVHPCEVTADQLGYFPLYLGSGQPDD